MPIPTKVAAYLKKNNITFETVAHRTVFTAFDLANTLKEKLENIGKTLLVKADKQFVLVVVPANRRLDLKKLKASLGASKIVIANEKDMVAHFKVKPGAITPFGALHKVAVIADRSLLKAGKLLLGAGSFTESLRMKVADFVKLEHAKLANFTESAGLPTIKQPKPKKSHKKGTKRPAKGKPKKRK